MKKNNRKIKLTAIFLLFLNVFLQANYAQVHVPVVRYQSSQHYSLPFYHHFFERVLQDDKLQAHLQIQNLDNEAHTKYYTDVAYRKKVDAFNQLIFNCNSIDKFVRILARYQILTYQFKGPHAFLVKKIKDELAQRYFDRTGKLINPEEVDQTLGALVDSFFKSVFNHEMYLKTHNILHDDASLEIISREKKGLLGWVFSGIAFAFKSIPEYVSSCFRSGCTIKQAVDNDYNKQIVTLIQFLQKGDFEQAKKLLIVGDQLMEEIWWGRETICFQSGGQLPEKQQPSTQTKILATTKLPEFEIQSGNTNKQVIAAGEHLEYAKVANDCLSARKQGLHESITSPHYTKVEYQFSHDVKKLLTEQKISPILYRFCVGNQLQQVLHQEFLHLLTIISKIKFAVDRVTDSSFLTAQVVSSVDLGREHNQLGFIKKAVLFANLSWGLLEHATHQLFRMEDECVKGALEGSLQGIAHFFNTVLDPIGTYNSFVEMAHSLGSIAEKIIIECEPNILYTKEQHDEIWEKRWQKIAAVSSTLKERFSKMSVRDLARFGASTAVETILFEKAMGTFAKLFKAGVKELASVTNKINEASKVAEVVATAAEGISVETRITKEMGEQVAYAMEVTSELSSDAKIATKTLLPARATIGQLPKHIVDRIKSAENYFKYLLKLNEKEIMQNIALQIKKSGLIEALEAENINCEWLKNIKIKNIDFKHVLIGDIQKGELTGLHSSVLCPEKIKRVTIQAGKRGTWVGKWFEEGVRNPKSSSFFPQTWNEKMIVEKIIESLNNILEVKFKNNKLLLSGMTSENIGITVVINNGGNIKTFFPAIKINGVLCIP